MVSKYLDAYRARRALAPAATPETPTLEESAPSDPPAAEEPDSPPGDPNPPAASVEAPAAQQPVEQSVATEATSPDRVEFAKSSNVRVADLGADGVLTVEFADGKKYQFANFTRDLLEEWRAASSAGSWFHHQVRKKPERFPPITPAKE